MTYWQAIVTATLFLGMCALFFAFIYWGSVVWAERPSWIGRIVHAVTLVLVFGTFIYFIEGAPS